MGIFSKLLKKEMPNEKIADVLTGLVINSDKANQKFNNLIAKLPEDKQNRLFMELLYFRIFTIDFAAYQVLGNSNKKVLLLDQFYANLRGLFANQDNNIFSQIF